MRTTSQGNAYELHKMSTPTLRKNSISTTNSGKCKACSYQWTENHKYRDRPLAEKAFTVFLYYHGLSMNAIAKMLCASLSPILRMDTKFQQSTCTTPRTPSKCCCAWTRWDVALSEKNKRWIWKALCRGTGELIDWECGHRDKATLKTLIHRLEKWDFKVYYTDAWPVYAPVIPREKLVQTKARHTGSNATMATCTTSPDTLSTSLLSSRRA